MAAINGLNTNMALKLNTTATAWGTAGAFGGTDKIIAQINYDDSAPILARSGQSSGQLFGASAERGVPTMGISVNFIGGQTEEALPPGFQNGFDRCIAQFFGAATAPVEANSGTGDYYTRFTFSSSLNTCYCTIGVQETSTEVAEFASVAFSSLNFDASNPASYPSATFTGIASGIESDSPTNSYATIGSQTIAADEDAVVQPDDDFWLNAQSAGALSTSDQLNITGYNLTLNKPQSQKNEIKGSSGSGSPTLDGQYTGELTLTFKELPDHTIIEHWESETYLKCQFRTKGSLYAGGINKHIVFFIPRMKLLTRPAYNPASAGTNPYTATFRLFTASAAPTGMNSTMPYCSIANGRSTAYIA